VKIKTFRQIRNIWVKFISQMKLWQFATALFNCGQLQTLCSKLGYME